MALRFILASFASALSALLMITITIPLFLYVASGEVTGEGFRATLIGMLAMTPLVVLIGGIVALPVAALAGGAMLLWQKQRAVPLATRHWLIAGAAAGLLVALFIGTNDPDNARIVAAFWFTAAGALAAWTFARVMRR